MHLHEGRGVQAPKNRGRLTERGSDDCTHVLTQQSCLKLGRVRNDFFEKFTPTMHTSK